MRRSVLAATSVAVLACLGACSSDSDTASADVEAVEATPTPAPTPSDPYAWTDVDYEDYLEAAKDLGLRPDVLVPQAGFSSGLNTLCRSSAEELADLRRSHATYTETSDTYSTAKYLGEEVGLRLGLACPQRMGDWTAAATENEPDADGGEENSAVTDEDLARATEEEANGAGHSSDADESHGHGSYGHGSYGQGDDDEDATSSPSTGGSTTGNSTAQN